MKNNAIIFKARRYIDFNKKGEKLILCLIDYLVCVLHYDQGQMMDIKYINSRHMFLKIVICRRKKAFVIN